MSLTLHTNDTGSRGWGAEIKRTIVQNPSRLLSSTVKKDFISEMKLETFSKAEAETTSHVLGHKVVHCETMAL